MKLVDRCALMRSQIHQRNNIRRAQKEAQSFTERAGELRAARETVGNALQRLVVLKAKGINVGKLPSPSTAMTILLECELMLSDNPTDSGKDYGRLKRSIEKLGKDLTEVATRATESLRRDLPSVDEAFLRQVEVIPGYATRVANVRQQRDGILNGNDPNGSAEALGQFLDRRQALRKLADDLSPDEFPKEVLEFFKAGRHGGAPLDKLTNTVREWLSERDLLKNIRVTVVTR